MTHRRHLRFRPVAIASAVSVAGLALAACGSSGAPTTSNAGANSHVLLVGTYDGKAGTYKTIQDAVDAAKAGDWILIGPGDYHEDEDQIHPPSSASAGDGDMAGVLISTPDIHLRGMNRSTVIVDGTKQGAPKPCDSAANWQRFGEMGSNGKAYGRNGIVVWKANDVSVDNLTICNFLGGTGASGNEVWWNGGDGSGQIGLAGYWGSYLTATSSYFGGDATAAQYGIFSSNSKGPGLWDQLYANNFDDSGMYVGACHQVCDITIEHAWMEYNALGYSGTNSGGAIVIKDSKFDHNEDGLDTNTQASGDPPAPQNGQCPDGATSPITHTRSCWVFMDNSVYDNNNASTPKAGEAAAGPTGTGMTLSGGRFDTVMDDTFSDNGAWGILFVPYPDMGAPLEGETCSGTGGNELSGFGCVYDPQGDALLNNTFVNNGYFGNPSNSDFGQVTVFAGQPQNCFRDNTAPNGSAPPDLEKLQPVCGVKTKSANTGGPLLDQVICDTGYGSCPKGANYPKSSTVVLSPVPEDLPTMPNPCAGVPTNPWCPDKSSGYSMRASPPGAPRLAGKAGGSPVSVPILGLAGVSFLGFRRRPQLLSR